MSSSAPAPAPEVTQLLRKAGTGDPEAQEQLFQTVYTELRHLARRAMRKERPDHTLQPTALVNEAFIRLMGGAAVDWVDRDHFFAIAAKTMRRVLIDYARNVHSQKKWGGQRVELGDSLAFTEEKTVALLALDEAMERLEAKNERQCKVVELKYFGGLGVDEIARVLGVNAKTVSRDWNKARAWLHGEIHSVP